MCGFGIQLEKRPHRFDRLHDANFKSWDYWMHRCCIDKNGEPFGWGVRDRENHVTMVAFWKKAPALLS